MIWDTQQPESAKKRWLDLTANERWAAETLGYSEAGWNENDDKLKPATYYKMWAQMSNQELTALIILGFSQTNWDNSALPLPETAVTSWDGLSVCGDNGLVTKIDKSNAG